MMYTFFEQLQMAVYFIILGFFAAIMIDACTYINFKSKIITYLIQIAFWVGITFVMMNAVMKISYGYIPIYTFLFFLIGFIIYKYLFRKELLKTINKIKSINATYRNRISTIILPKELWRFLLKVLKTILKGIIKKKKKVEETPQEVI